MLKPRHGPNKKSTSQHNQIFSLFGEEKVEDINLRKKRMENLLEYQWRLYSELARQRNEIQDQIKKVLIQSCLSNYEFHHWQRAVKYKYGLHPFSTVGSLSYIGGRFNTGKGVNSEVPHFPALYLAKNKDTALQEHLAQEKPKAGCLTSREIALTNPSSETIISVSGHMDKVFDLRTHKSLESLVKLFKHFTLSNDLIKLGKDLKITTPTVINTAKSLLGALLSLHWRREPAISDIPSNSQIFGHLVYSGEIEGILYPSKFTHQPCLALFPRNCYKTDSFIKIDDETPHKNVPDVINSSNWRMCDLKFEEIHATINRCSL